MALSISVGNRSDSFITDYAERVRSQLSMERITNENAITVSV
jgi:hypothetical protein